MFLRALSGFFLCFFMIGVLWNPVEAGISSSESIKIEASQWLNASLSSDCSHGSDAPCKNCQDHCMHHCSGIHYFLSNESDKILVTDSKQIKLPFKMGLYLAPHISKDIRPPIAA